MASPEENTSENNSIRSNESHSQEEGGNKISKSEAEQELRKYLKGDETKESEEPSGSEDENNENERKDEASEINSKEEKNTAHMEDVEEQLSQALGKDSEVQKGDVSPDESNEAQKEKDIDREEIERKTRAHLHEEENGQQDENKIQGEGLQAQQKKKEKKRRKAARQLQRLKTYKDDLNKSIKEKGKSVAGMMSASAQTKGKEGESQVPQKDSSDSVLNNKILMILLAVLLIGGLAGGGFFLWQKYFQGDSNGNTSGQNKKEQIDVNSLIRVEGQKEIDTTNKTPREILNRMDKIRRGTSLPLGEVVQIYLTSSTGQQSSTNNKQTPTAKNVLGSKGFLERIEAARAPELSRALKQEFLLGIHSYNRNQPFILFKVDSYQGAFSEMLKWEEDIEEDLSPLFDPVTSEDFTSASATTSQETFKDTVIQNHDVRLLRDENGKILLMYSFPNTENLIITTNKQTFEEVLTRMRKPGLIK